MANSEIKLSSIEEIIDEAKNGRMFILIDDEDRENEGDLFIPAEFADANAINFMAKWGRGLICLSMDEKRVEELNLPLMSQSNKSRHQTAFTVSIEAREGVTTGISAADRARTVEVAIDPSKSKYDLVSPGHVFPLIAKNGGVLVRAGHTEAAVDISRLAGLNPSGVICEIMNDDGTMARLPELLEFAEQHQIKIATIADLIEYRRSKENLIERISTSEFNCKYGNNFKLHIYKSKLEYAEHLALVKGDIKPDEPTLVRVQQLNLLNDVLGASYQDEKFNEQLQKSIKIIEEEGKGVIVLLRSPNKQSLTNAVDKYNALNSKDMKVNDDVNLAEKKIINGSLNPVIRDYGIGAQILLDIGVRRMTLLSNSNKNIVGLEGYGLELEGNHNI